MGKQTPLYAAHQAAHAKIVDFAGWDMPLHYGSQLNEHHFVRQDAGMFDVSHMGVIDLYGKEATAYLRYVLANNVDRLVPGKALYTCMLNEQGGVIDDLIVYQINPETYRLVVNAGTRETDVAWLLAQASRFGVKLIERADLAIIAVQGPNVIEKLHAVFSAGDYQAMTALKPFHFVSIANLFVARTGYTGEDGFEIILPAQEAQHYWQQFVAAGIKPCGLGARDTLRLEAGLNLYGSDMDQSINPFEANLGWTVALDPADRLFIGRSALEAKRKVGITQRLVGLVLQGPGIIRHDQAVLANGIKVGSVTSGGYSPTLDQSIALARVPAELSASCAVEIRQKAIPATIVKPPFVRHGKKVF